MAEREPAVGDKREASGPAVESPAKLVRSSSDGRIQPSPGTQKLAVFCHSGSRDNKGGFQIYVFDLDIELNKAIPSKYSVINPNIRYEGNEEWVGCVLNSTLYIFQRFRHKMSYLRYEYDNLSQELNCIALGCQDSIAKKFDLSPLVCEGARAVKKFDLSSLESKKEIGIDQFVPLAPMRYHKGNPIAIPTPNGKILVIDQVLEEHKSHHGTYFELYDPSLDLWTPVTPPEFSHPSRQVRYDIRKYTFIDESCFLMSTPVGNFVLDLNPEKKKKKEDDSIVAKSKSWFGSPHGLTIDGDEEVAIAVAIGLGEACRLGSNVYFRFQLSSPPPEGVYESLCPVDPCVILWNHSKGRHIDNLISQIHLIEKGGRCYLTVDAYRTDVATLKTEILGTLKYAILNEGSVMGINTFVF